MDSLSPIGPERGDLQAASIVQAVLKTTATLGELAIPWDAEAAEEEHAARLKKKFLGRANPTGR